MNPNWPCRPDERELLVREILGRVADKWTLLVLDALEEGELRFGQVREKVGTISQKMLTKTLRQLERDGLVVRTVRPVIPPHVDYRLTPLGLSLAESVCGVWLWVEAHMADVQRARQTFDESPPVNASPTATPRPNRRPEA
jgi:DNA-binding HxlR family transcriptional regulator